MPRKNEPKKAETRQRKNCRLKFPPNLVSLAHPSMDGVIKNYQRSDRSENADNLNQPNPNVPAITEIERPRPRVFIFQIEAISKIENEHPRETNYKFTILRLKLLKLAFLR